MAYFHNSGRPRPARVFAVLEPGEAPDRAAAVSPGTARTTVLLPVAPGAPRRRAVWPAAAVGLVVLAATVVLYLKSSPGPVEVVPTIATRPVKPARTSIFAPSKTVVTGENWTYGRTGKPPKQTLPSAAAVAAYRNEMEKLAERQRQQLSASRR